jgi:hypothetical protein
MYRGTRKDAGHCMYIGTRKRPVAKSMYSHTHTHTHTPLAVKRHVFNQANKLRTHTCCRQKACIQGSEHIANTHLLPSKGMYSMKRTLTALSCVKATKSPSSSSLIPRMTTQFTCHT